MRNFLCCMLLFTGGACFAQQSVYFFKNDGTEVKSRSEADYYRIIDTPQAGSGLYTVNEYFATGKQKLVGKTSRVSPVIFQGQVASFYPNGKKMQLANYQNNRLCGLFYNFYTNGKIHEVRQYPEPPTATSYKNYRIIDCLDSTGKTYVKDGEGYYYSFNSLLNEEGPVTNGLRNGDWKGADNVFKVSFTEHYVEGELVMGVAVDTNGKKYNYVKQRYTEPQYHGGEKAMYATVISRLKNLLNNTVSNLNGKAYIRFTVVPGGKIEHIRVLNSASEAANDNIALVISSTASKWEAGSRYGIPIKMVYTMPVNFTTTGLQGVFD